MLSDVTEKRIEDISMISDELSHILPRDGWTDYAFTLLARLQKLAVILDDEDDGAEARADEVFSNIRLDATGEEAFKAALAKKYNVTDEEKSQGYFFRNVNGNNIKFSAETFQPIDGQMKAMGGTEEVASSVLKQKEQDRKSGKGQDKKIGKNVKKVSGTPYPIEEISATGENKPCLGFAPGQLDYHKNVLHSGQYDGMTDEQYEDHAINLLKKKCGKDVLGYRCSDGCVCRFNNLTGEFAKGYPGGNVKTCFFPTRINPDGTKTFDLEFARQYYRRMKRDESFDD
jgi:hypothetical protein